MYATKMRRAAANERICCVSGTCIRLHYSAATVPHICRRWQMWAYQMRSLHHNHVRSAQAQARQHALDGELERPINRKSAGAFMAAATECLSYGGDVHSAFAAQAYAEAPVRQFTEERG